MGKIRKPKSKPIGLYEFIEKLRSEKIHFDLASYREDAIMIQIAVSGERWEVEFFPDGTVEIERFRSDGSINSHTELDLLFTAFAETNSSQKRAACSSKMSNKFNI